MSRPTTTGSRPRPGPPDLLAPAASPFTERARAVRRASLRWKLALAGALVIAVVAVWCLWWSPLLVIKDVQVDGVRGADASAVTAAARVPSGEQLARVDLNAVRRRVAAVPIVASVEVSRGWPTTLVITVRPRTPVAVVRDASGGLHLADATGTAYAGVASAPDGLPVVTASASNAAAVQAVIEVLGAIPADLRGQVSSAGATSPDSVTLKIGKATVSWGNSQDSRLKAEVFTALRRANPGATRFDLSAPDQPAVG
jgi:cell division protein FtsQ